MSTRSTRHRACSSQGEIRSFEGMSKINTAAAGVDIGAHEIMACVPDGDDQQLVRAFGTYTADLESLADWFIDRGIQTVAMESTGVYWISLFETLEAHGISNSLAQTILAEMGTDMSKWPDDKHFCSWLGLAPKNDISGGKVLRSRTMKNRNRAAQAFRMAAQSVLRADGAFGAFYRRLKGRLGPAQALVATAHKMARTVSHMHKDRVPYHDIGAAEYNHRFRERELQYLQKKAAKLGSTLSLASPSSPQ